MKKKIIIVVSWAAVAACMTVIFSLSAQTGGESEGLSGWVLLFMKLNVSQEFIRTCAHFLEYAGLAVLIFNALYQTFGYLRPVLSFIISAAYAVSDEIHQLFVEGRAFQFIDIFIDCAGAAGGIIVLFAAIKLISNMKRRRSR